MTDTKALTAALPGIIARGDTQAARDLVCSPRPDLNAWLPEALMAFNTAGLTPRQKQEMVEAIFPGAKNTINLGNCNARLGRLGFSFPIWRFLAQGFNQSSLIEQFGMTKLKRNTDIADPTLPNPARDLFGTGFVVRDSGKYIEYRRAYIACANKNSAIIIRNNSYFFGRDRLPAPVYVSFTPLKDIENLRPEDFDNLTRWQDITPSAGNIERIETLLNTLDNFDMKLNDWLKQDGLKALTEFLNSVKEPKPFIGIIEKDMPPWFPKQVLPVTSGLLSGLKAVFNVAGENKAVLLSGPTGDLPLPLAIPSL